MTPTKYNLSIWCGNTRRLELRFKDAEGNLDQASVEGSLFVLRIVDRGKTQVIRQERIASGGILVFELSAAETRGLNKNDPHNYEIERRIGTTQETWFYGTVKVQGGDNDD